MCPQEPHSLTGSLELSVQVPHQGHERPSTTIRGNDGCTIRATKRVFRMVTDSPSKETAMKIQQIYADKKINTCINPVVVSDTYSSRGVPRQCASVK